MSTIPAAKSALLAVVQAAVPAVQVTYGNAGQYMDAETVFIADVVDYTDTPGIGQVQHREDYHVPVVVSIAWQGGPDEAASWDAHLHAIYGAIVAAIRALKGDLNAAGVVSAYVDGSTFDSYLSSETAGGTVYEAVIQVRVKGLV